MRVSALRNPEIVHGSANLFHNRASRKQRKLNNIQELQFWKLSQPVRQCFKCVKCERAETVVFISWATKKGRIFRRALKSKLNVTLRV